jgi:hypothetical protein
MTHREPIRDDGRGERMDALQAEALFVLLPGQCLAAPARRVGKLARPGTSSGAGADSITVSAGAATASVAKTMRTCKAAISRGLLGRRAWPKEVTTAV